MDKRLYPHKIWDAIIHPCPKTSFGNERILLFYEEEFYQPFRVGNDVKVS